MLIAKPVSVYDQYMAQLRAEDAAKRERAELEFLLLRFRIDPARGTCLYRFLQGAHA